MAHQISTNTFSTSLALLMICNAPDVKLCRLFPNSLHNAAFDGSLHYLAIDIKFLRPGTKIQEIENAIRQGLQKDFIAQRADYKQEHRKKERERLDTIIAVLGLKGSTFNLMKTAAEKKLLINLPNKYNMESDSPFAYVQQIWTRSRFIECGHCAHKIVNLCDLVGSLNVGSE
ncbi:hypothetical protein M9H77_18647 [Catharanthus roseus]|uniref:Uncharacterized protein n=1 Tax=Catharanthus roseus TaxID=4058 RepID=A0ACC0B803_CATRO|nr:hypothetical protein M9H77_18647 [Catharanthus roseus]